MRVFIDITDFLLHLRHSDTVTGIQRVILEVSKTLAAQNDTNRFFFCYYSLENGCFVSTSLTNLDFTSAAHFRFLRKFGELIGTNLANRASKRKRWFSRINQRVREWVLLRELPDYEMLREGFESNDKLIILGAVWGIADYASLIRPAIRKESAELVLYCHDLIPLEFPEFTGTDASKKYLTYLCEIAPLTSLFLCNSKVTEHDLRKFLNERKLECKICVVPLAHEFGGVRFATRSDRTRIRAAVLTVKIVPYILCVGTVEARKNHWRLALGFKKALDLLQRGSIQLVIAGRRGWNCEQFFHYMDGTGYLGGHVTWIDNPTDAELELLYRNCLFSIFPSLCEGWGLPVGESIWFRKRCVASNRSSIPEVGGAAVDYFDPTDIEQISNAIARHVNSSETIEKFDKLVSDFRLRTWSDVGNQILQVLIHEQSNHKYAVRTGYHLGQNSTLGRPAITD